MKPAVINITVVSKPNTTPITTGMPLISNEVHDPPSRDTDLSSYPNPSGKNLNEELPMVGSKDEDTVLNSGSLLDSLKAPLGKLTILPKRYAPRHMKLDSGALHSSTPESYDAANFKARKHLVNGRRKSKHAYVLSRSSMIISRDKKKK